MNLYETKEMNITQKPNNNPLKGYAALSDEIHSKINTSLKYITIYWNEIEKEEGVYDFDELEDKMNMNEWKREGKRFILRIVCDEPSKNGDMKIPQWLYEKTNDGIWYDTSYGKGYSPNYENPIFISAHNALVQAIGERYNNDPYIICIQLGSLGHWGEWHVNNDEAILQFPLSNITEIYINQYKDAFSNKILQVRRPINYSDLNDFGLYNDVFGYEKGTYRWLEWCKKGYVSDQTNEKIKALNKPLNKRYIGGEIASYEPMEYYFSDGFESMMQQLKDTSMSYIGPNTPIWLDSSFQNNIELLESELGYCFAIKKVGSLKIGNTILLRICLTNLNEIPMAENWTVRLYCYDKDGNAFYSKDIDAKLNELTNNFYINTTLPINKLTEQIGLAIIDPITNEPGVQLANDEIIEGLIYKIK